MSDTSPGVERDPSNRSLDAKAGQLFLVGFEGTALDSDRRAFLREFRPGGVVYFGRNVESPAQVGRLSRDLRDALADAGSPPPLVAVDQEGGLVTRLDWADSPGAMAVGATRDPDLARDLGAAVGRELRSLGITLNLAPVLDVNDEPENPVIGSRSFGEDPELVGELGTAAARGLREGGVAACGKHFPGHGNTVTDSHRALPRVERDGDRLAEVELPPFGAAADARIEAVMTAHVEFPALDAGTPATLSRACVNGLLRERLGFDGVVVTDCMEMSAIADTVGTAEGAVRALEAGCDLITVSHDPAVQRTARDAVVEAVRERRLSEERLDRSIRRISRLKRALRERTAGAAPEAARHERRAADRRVAEASVTLVRDRRDLLAVTEAVGTVHLLALPASRGSAVEGERDSAESRSPAYLSHLRRGLGDAEVSETILDAEDSLPEMEAEDSLPEMEADDLAVVCLAGPADRRERVADRLLETPASVVGVAVGGPYALSALASASTLLTTYDPNPASLRVAGEILVGERDAKGRLPVSIPGVTE